MITAAKLTRTALELDIPAHVFTDTARNLRTLNAGIYVAFVAATEGDYFEDTKMLEEAFDTFYHRQIQTLLAGLDA